MLSLVVFPSTIVLMGIIAFLVGWRRHTRFMDSIRARRAAEFNASHLTSTMAYEPEVLITNVMRADESILIGYQPYTQPEQRVSRAQATFVAFGSDSDVFERLEGWCEQQACIRVELDHLDSRLRLCRLYTTEQIELSMVPKKNVG
ncbi:hypothetical protein FEAC_03380 [Ferrimicrobium acidiphilum DSM 19497]|jgi:hypothetical protein|uniref:Uncharacterized protein n=2 Tax=Ferrimicrobium acidiphilum TaxID=121039 RepID=A0A0D8FXT8_9ACTN|nr:hypothetical protein FEAC_03380 [Ferrimicrobium acidiphilum DSM 19497]